jgi:hypothetical protein
MNYSPDQLWVAIPAMDEADWLPICLQSLASQSIGGFHVLVCVNQPDEWWTNPEKVRVCEQNIGSLRWLESMQNRFPFKLHLLDRTSPGKGWKTTKGGSGAARKAAMDEVIRLGGSEIYLVSTDADTTFDATYLADIIQRFAMFPKASAIAAPYIHPTTGDENIDQAIIRYELFMRFHLLNLIRIRSPYAFTAIGSAMAFTGECYLRVGGVASKAYGEDFYLLQKVAKSGRVLSFLPSTAYPSARLSDRVVFGTGPTIAGGIGGNPSRYPVIHPDRYTPVQKLYDLLEVLYQEDTQTPVDPFLIRQFGKRDIWQDLRVNSRSLATFVKACHQKFDGLRLWQFLRQGAGIDDSDEAFRLNMHRFLPDYPIQQINGWNDLSLGVLTEIRRQLIACEMNMRKQYDEID